MRDLHINKLLGATLLSGVLSGITLITVPGAIFVAPGLLFGLATSWVFVSIKRFDMVQSALWLAASAAAWYAAFYEYETLSNWTPGDTAYTDPFLTMVLAGLIGSLILAVVLSLLARKVTLKNTVLTASIAVAVTAVMYQILNYGSGTNLGGSDDFGAYVRLATAFSVWQVGVGLSLIPYLVPANWKQKRGSIKPLQT